MSLGAQIGPEFEAFDFTHHRRVHEVFRAGAGPAVLVLPEIPGLHPGVVDFARRLIAAGHRVYLPSLFGRPAAPATGREIARTMMRVCVAREFTKLADRTSPVVGWLRALAALAHRECGGPGVGVVGMCFTGGFALATALEPSVIASVMSQPAMPAPIGARGRAALGLDAEDLATVAARAEHGLRVLGLRFTQDRGCPPERFETLRATLGAAFEGIEIDSSPGNAAGIASSAHSVLTVSLVDEPGHPTRLALDRVLALLAERLRPADPEAP
jgi:dienelactone hydrolase